MTPSFIRVVLWKEFRELAPFWIVLAAVGLGIEAIWISNLWGEWVEVPSAINLLQTAIVLAGLFLVGCGGAQFAAEKENGTYTFLRALPTGSTRLFFVKITAALVGNLLMLGLLLGVMTLTPHFPERLDPEQKWLAAAIVLQVIVLGVFFWIVFFSLISRRTFAAIMLGLTVGLFVPWSTAFVCKDNAFVFIGVQVVLVTAAIVLDVCFAGRWFREKGPWMPPMSVPKEVVDTKDVQAPAQMPPNGASLFFRLAWQQMRESARGWLLTALVVAAATVVFVNTAWSRSGGPEMGRTILLLGALLLPPRLGAIVFRADQKDCRFRFLAEHGLSPRLLWVTRQITGILGTIPFILLGVCLAALAFWDDRWAIFRNLPGVLSEEQAIRTLALIGAGMISAYAAGQFCSMTIRSPLVAGFSAVGLAILGYSAATFLDFFHVNGFLLAAAWTVSLFVATYLGTDAWMTERRSWRTGAMTAGVLVASLLVVVAGTALYRVYQLPVVPLDIQPTYLLPEIPPGDRHDGESFSRLLRSLPEPEELRKMADPDSSDRDVEGNRGRLHSCIGLIAKNRSFGAEVLYDPAVLNSSGKAHDARERTIHTLTALDKLLPLEANRLADEGEYDKAMDCLVAKAVVGCYARRSSCGALGITLEPADWRSIRRIALASTWTPEQLLKLMKRLDTLTADTPGASAEVRRDYLDKLSWIEGQPARSPSVDPLKYAARFLPWERHRAIRGLRIIAKRVLHEADVYDSAVTENLSLPLRQSMREWEQWDRRYLEFFQEGPFSFTQSLEFMQREIHTREYERRGTRVALTLLAWRREHGSFPDQLGQLVEEGMIDSIPELVYFGGAAIQYDPQGFSKQVELSVVERPGRGVRWQIPEGTPILWLPSYASENTSYSIRLLPADERERSRLKRALRESRRVMPYPGMGGGMAMGGGRPGPAGMDGGAGGPPMPAAGMPQWDDPPPKDPYPPFLRKFDEFQEHVELKRALVIPLGPVEVTLKKKP